MNYTPGPWAARKFKTNRSDDGVIYHFFGKRSNGGYGDTWYKLTEGGGRDDPLETAANARLITAAPDLLDALRLVLQAAPLNHPDDDIEQFDWVRAARAAITKATD